MVRLCRVMLVFVGIVWVKLDEDGIGCLRLGQVGEVGMGWNRSDRLGEVGIGWVRLVELLIECMRLSDVGWGWMRLGEVGPAWERLCVVE